VDRFYPIGLSKLTVILLGSSIQMMNEVKKTCTGFWADKGVPQLLTWDNQDELMDSIPMQELFICSRGCYHRCQGHRIQLSLK
jgi:hypothetical protein